MHFGNYRLRPFAASDAPAFSEAVQESLETVGRWMSWVTPGYTVAEAQAWFELCENLRSEGLSHEYGIFDLRDDAFIGGAGLNQFNVANSFCNLGYWVRASRQRRGAAKAAIHCLRELAFETLGQTRVEIVIADGNEPSLAAARSSGAFYECLASNRLKLHGRPVQAHVFSFVPNIAIERK